MKSNCYTFIVITILSMLLSACGGEENTDVAVIVALTQTAAVQDEEFTTIEPEAAVDIQATEIVQAPEPDSGAFDTGALTQADPQRVQFAAGTSSARIESLTRPGVCDLYLLGAQQGQQMDVKLVPDGSVSLGCWGADGSLLLSTQAGETELHDFLPFTQDYTLEVCPMVDAAVSYTLDIFIAPLAETMSVSSYIVHPSIAPFGAADMQLLTATGVPQMLPSSFPGDSETDPVVPYMLLHGSQEFDASLDYGTGCQGTGACHYGIYSGKYVGAAATPVSTPNVFFDASLSQTLSLDRGITGYYIPSACGANCSDAMIFFIYDEYQYGLGMRAASQEQVMAIVNDAINNSIP